MFQLSEKHTQEIVDKMMQDIPYNINIMNERGVIVGSGRKERVGTVHPGAVKALETGRMIEVWEDSRFEKKGTNEPIVIDRQRVGVIGISGNPDEVRPFCNIVRTTVSLLIEQKTSLQSLADEANRKKVFIEMLLAHQGAYSQKLRKEAVPYNLNLLLPTVVLYICHLRVDDRISKLLLRYPTFVIQDDTYLLLLQNDPHPARLLAQLAQEQPQVRIACGRLEGNIRESFRQAQSAMNVLLALRPPSQTISYDEVEFLVKFSHAKLTDTGQAVSKLEDSIDLLDTLRSFIRQDCSVARTADELKIHRNTLQYRLKRMEAITGKDPHKLLHLIELTHGLLSLYK